MNKEKIFDIISTFGLDTEHINQHRFFPNIIHKKEIIKLIYQTLLEHNKFPIATENIEDGIDWMIKKGPFLGYHLIQYDERGMSNFAECWRKWFLTKAGAAKEYLKRATGDVIIINLSSN